MKLRMALLILFAIAVGYGLRNEPGSAIALVPENAWASPSRLHLLGCGEGGVDVLAVASNGIVRALLLAVAVPMLGLTLGLPLGAAAAFYGRDRTLARVCDLLQSFPTFLLAMVILASVERPSRLHLVLVFGLTAWVPFARLAAVETRVLRNAGYVEAARALGLSGLKTLRVHIVPALWPTARVQLGASAAATVVSEAALAFVGFGPKDGVSLGALLDQGVVSMLRAPHVLLVGALSVFFTSRLLIYVYGYGLRAPGKA
jgi:peptide/nickel transport system permease protein